MVTVLDHKGYELQPCHESVARKLTKLKHAYKGHKENGSFFIRCFSRDDETYCYSLMNKPKAKE